MMFINRRVGSDVYSVRIESINGKTAIAVPVRKNPKIEVEMVPGGFVGHCTNNDKLFADGNYELVDDGSPFEILLKKTKKGEVWGEMQYKWSMTLFGDEAHIDNIIENRSENTGYEKFQNEDGDYGVTLFSTTKTGKPSMTFVPYGNGKMVDHCDWYYDYNF